MPIEPDEDMYQASPPSTDMSVDRAVEYLDQLQAALDAAREREVALRKRVSILERDRATLQAKLDKKSFSRWTRRARTSSEVRQDQSEIPELPQANHDAPVIACVLDEFSAQAFAPDAHLVHLTPDNWQRQLAPSAPAMLLVESAFAGHEAQWTGRIARFGQPSQALVDIVTACREASIPTVFWNKEDPINFEMFAVTAGLFDVILSVDVDSLERYRRLAPHASLGVLPFAAQPAIHYPPVAERPRGVAFAGAYYAAKHPERQEQMELILDPAREFGLDIYDRLGKTDPRFRWPEKYQAHIRGTLSYAETVQMYRAYKVFLNVNTVTDSPTMCSRRIFELLACGTTTVSGPSRAIAELIPADLVLVANTPDETRQHIRRALNDVDYADYVATEGPKWIADGNTYADRLGSICRAAGLLNSGAVPEA